MDDDLWVSSSLGICKNYSMTTWGSLSPSFGNITVLILKLKPLHYTINSNQYYTLQRRFLPLDIFHANLNFHSSLLVHVGTVTY